MLEIKQQYLRLGSQRRPGLKIKGPSFIVAHDVGVVNSSAQNNVDFYLRPADDTTTSAHTFVDDKGPIEIIPDTEVAYHVRYSIPDDNTLFGVDANDGALGIELCYFSDKTRTMQAYNNYCEYIAMKCKKFNLDPKTRIVGHFRLDPTRRTDPINAFKTIGKTWQDFIGDVVFYTKTAIPTPSPEESVTITVPKSKLDRVLLFIKQLVGSN